MIDELINFYKTIPNLWELSKARIAKQWRWFALPAAVALILLILLVIVTKVAGITDITVARWYYRLTGLTTFIFFWAGVRHAYYYFKQDVVVMKMFKMSPYFHVALISVIYAVLMWVINLIILLTTPVNIDSSVFGTILYGVMSLPLMFVVASILGLLAVLYRRTRILFYSLVIISFLLVPILYIPSHTGSVWTHLIMLNPVCYLVKGSAEANVIGLTSVSNIAYHLYECLLIAIGFVVIYALNRYVAYHKFEVTPHSDEMDDETSRGNSKNKAGKVEDKDKKETTRERSVNQEPHEEQVGQGNKIGSSTDTNSKSTQTVDKTVREQIKRSVETSEYK
ncbi:hypothetical protein CD039_06190 [Staphylococcus argensis]|uniref:Uncharacterized protein n=1 Tax=Staphylococcus argensis TaxID=1607738 RepID=A0A2K4FHB3_9STAP|nr:hypothetical protein [Staphylococcus argensis]POA10325.1 hypothetical protein CD039_06190 [Staphylococcus argensis]